MGDNLVIVESPAKAKTIERFLGKEFSVKSSYGHIRDLEKKNFGIDIENNYQPKYEISPEKRKVVAELRKLVKNADTVWLASDEDREGEAIAWHLFEVLKLKENKTKRIVFNEITENAILKAIKSPRKINQNLVNAQQARRVLDRLVGFELSPVLWRKVKPSLSAGRVQSVAVRLIVEREREIIAFEEKPYYKISGLFFNDKKQEIKAQLNKQFDDDKSTVKFLESCKNADYFVKDIKKKPGKRTPAAPFTTSTLQQEASRKFGFSVSQTMSVAQKLYEEGKITYMRTDSVNLSATALNSAKSAILEKYGEKYYKKRQYKTKSKSAQEAHEAIRPTYMENQTVDGNYNEQKLYQLIWKRTVASQMADAIMEKTTIDIGISTNNEVFTAQGEVIKFDGFMKLYIESLDDEMANKQSSDILPPVKKDEKLALEWLRATERFKNHPPRYTEASLVRKLEELGIGRPSTYAPTISTVQKRGYVIKESRQGKERKYKRYYFKDNKITEEKNTEIAGTEKNKLFPTDIAMVVTDFLVDNFANIINFDFTAEVEKEFDEIAAGGYEWQQMIDKFYKEFHKKIEHTLENVGKTTGERLLGKDPENGLPVFARIGKYGPIVQLGENNDDNKPKFASIPKQHHIETITLEEAIEVLKHSSKGRYLGDDPKTKKPIYARIAKYGPIVQLGENDDEEKPLYASLKKGQTLDNVTLNDALELFKLPRNLGKFEDADAIVADGRFGPYVRHKSKFYSLKKTDDPYTIELTRAIELIEKKREDEIKRHIKSFDENPNIKIIKDRWGHPAIYYKKKYQRLPKGDKKPEDYTLKECLKLVNADIEKETKKDGKKKSSTKKTTNRKKTTTKKK